MDGTLDEGFGTDGIVTTHIGTEFAIEEALGVAVQPDGKIVAAGFTGRDVTVARYLSDGQLDDSFGTEGIVTGILAGRANDVIVDAEDRIVIVGQADVDDPLGDDFSDFFVARLLPDGQPDVGFGLAGQVVTDLGGVANEGQNVVIQPANGKIVVSGSTGAAGTLGFIDDHYTDVVRYTSEGQLDSTFGTGGTLTLAGPVGKDLEIQDDGRLLLVGTADTTPPAEPAGSVTELAVLRLEPGGTPDMTFGTEGTATVSVTGLTSSNGLPGRDVGTAIALQPDGRIVVAGSATATATGFNLKFAVARLLSDGTLDTDFTDTGAMTIDFFAFTDVAESVAVTGDGKIVVSGQVQNPGEVYGVRPAGPLGRRASVVRGRQIPSGGRAPVAQTGNA